MVEDDSYDRNNTAETIDLLKSVDFQFCLTLTIMSNLLKISHVVSKNMLSPVFNIAAAAVQVEALVSEIVEKRTEAQFEEFCAQTHTMAYSNGAEFTEQRT